MKYFRYDQTFSKNFRESYRHPFPEPGWTRCRTQGAIHRCRTARAWTRSRSSAPAIPLPLSRGDTEASPYFLLVGSNRCQDPGESGANCRNSSASCARSPSLANSLPAYRYVNELAAESIASAYKHETASMGSRYCGISGPRAAGRASRHERPRGYINVHGLAARTPSRTNGSNIARALEARAPASPSTPFLSLCGCRCGGFSWRIDRVCKDSGSQVQPTPCRLQSGRLGVSRTKGQRAGESLVD